MVVVVVVAIVIVVAVVIEVLDPTDLSPWATPSALIRPEPRDPSLSRASGTCGGLIQPPEPRTRACPEARGRARA